MEACANEESSDRVYSRDMYISLHYIVLSFHPTISGNAYGYIHACCGICQYVLCEIFADVFDNCRRMISVFAGQVSNNVPKYIMKIE